MTDRPSNLASTTPDSREALAIDLNAVSSARWVFIEPDGPGGEAEYKFAFDGKQTPNFVAALASGKHGHVNIPFHAKTLAAPETRIEVTLTPIKQSDGLTAAREDDRWTIG